MFPTFPTALCGAADGAVRLELPQTLHAQLFLLAYDRPRPVGVTHPWDPVLRAVLDDIGDCREREGLVDRGVPPITGMRRVIDAVHRATEVNGTGPYPT